MKRFIILLIGIAAISFIANAHSPYRYNNAPVWHDTGVFDKHDIMHSMLYGAFGVKYDYVQMDNVKLNTYGAYIEYCNIMASFTYGQSKQYKAFDASASFLIPIHPNFRLGPRIEYAGVGDRQCNGTDNMTKGYSTTKCGIGVTLDVHFKIISITANVSRNSIGVGLGWTFGHI